ncbi:uncharacterized protein LOC129746818 [Uranotaenia lowii]|uniref:uncharacterized protein LOC129746818 n=1 Tax=Uranotaenia lowii TaxID=190385 RepID=UPI002478F64D|nr:uncharacterized protein LOC129746818 [Uranotaenia lowii]
MALKEEILARLNNPEQDFITNLTYGIKLWRSNSFYYMSKYEIVFEFFIDGLMDFAKDVSPEQIEDKWAIVNEFLALPCLSNALPPRIIPKLLEVLKKLSGIVGDNRIVLESYLIVAFDTKYKNFYKFNFDSYTQALALALICFRKVMTGKFDPTQEEETMKRILDDLKIYVATAGDDAKWQKAFKLVLRELCEVVLILKSNGLDYQEELLELFKRIFFQNGRASEYNRITTENTKRLLMGHFDTKKYPLHVTGLLIEGYLRAYRDTKIDVLLLLKYILLYVFVDPEKSLISDIHEIFHLVKYVFHLLKKYFIKIDQQLVQDFDFNGIFTIKLKEFLQKYGNSEAQLRDLFSLICTINEYNPLILETSIIDILLRTMFIPKDPEMLAKYQDMLISTIDLYVKLNRSENFREELFMKLEDYLDDNDLADSLKDLRKTSLKRKSCADEELSTKRRKLDDGTISETIESKDQFVFFEALYPAKMEIVQLKLTQTCNQWKSLSFAWPDSNGRLSRAMLDYVKGLLTKRSFNYWYKMQNFISDVLASLEEEQTETELFKLEFSICWMCYFFAGNTLVEQTNLFWEKLNKFFTEFDAIMESFGKILLGNDNPNERVLSSFLKLAYFYGNYRLLVHYYRPDSIEDTDNHSIHNFLSDEQWKHLESIVPVDEKSYFDRINLQKIRATKLIDDSLDGANHSDTVQKIVENPDFNQLRPLLQDQSSCGWFLQLLDSDRQITVINLLFQNKCFDEITFIISQQIDDSQLMAIIVTTIVKEIIENAFENSSSAISKKISFDGIWEFDEERSMNKIKKLFSKKLEKGSGDVAIVNIEIVQSLLNIFDTIRLNELPQEPKIIIISISLLIYGDLLNSEQPELTSKLKNILNKQLIFGIMPNLFKYLTVDMLIGIFGQFSPLVVTIFRQTAVYLTQEAFECCQTILDRFQESQSQEETFELVLMVFNCLQKNNANRFKAIEADQLAKLVAGYVAAIEHFISAKEPTARKLRKSEPNLFNYLLKACSLVIHFKVVSKQELSEELRNIFLVYLDQALKMDSNFSSALLINALQYKDFLRMEPETLEVLVENRWLGFQAQLRQEITEDSNKETDETDIDGNLLVQNVKLFSSFLTHHQPADKLTARFEQLEQKLATDSSPKDIRFVLRVFATFAKNAFVSGFSQDMEKSFVRAFGSIVANHIMPLCVMKNFFEDMDCLEEILACFAAVVVNSKLTLVPSIMDNILEFLGCISIRKFVVKDGSEKTFYKLHRSISEVLYSLLVTRPNFIVNRLPHYFYVYNGLIASIICYKEDRPLEKPLNSFEILTLSDLMLPLEKISNMSTRKLESDLRILAPYILVQIVSYIIQSKRPATLHEKITRNVYNVCYELIGIYDKHSSEFILRTCDEATKNVYTDIVKGYRRYRSFRGKV